MCGEKCTLDQVISEYPFNKAKGGGWLPPPSDFTMNTSNMFILVPTSPVFGFCDMVMMCALVKIKKFVFLYKIKICRKIINNY